MEVVQAPSFEKDFADLPREIQVLCTTQLERLTIDDNDPRLHRKPLKGQAGVYSFRVTHRYRALFYINERRQLIVFAIKNRKDIYR